MAREGGLNFEHVRFDPVEMIDVAGDRHEFHFRLHLLGDRVSMEAFELRAGEPGGYQIQVIGEPEGDLFALPILAGLPGVAGRRSSACVMAEKRRHVNNAEALSSGLTPMGVFGSAETSILR